MEPRYMLDTDTCAFILRKSSQQLLERVQAVPLERQVVSMVTVAELLYGVQLSNRKKTNKAAVDALLRHVQALDWSIGAAGHYADLRADLKRRGQMIGSSDLMIAAHARSIDATVITNNVRDFGRVRGLRVENWMEPLSPRT